MSDFSEPLKNFKGNCEDLTFVMIECIFNVKRTLLGFSVDLFQTM